MKQLLKEFGVVAIERQGSCVRGVIERHGWLQELAQHIVLLRPSVTNEISSSVVRYEQLALRQLE